MEIPNIDEIIFLVHVPSPPITDVSFSVLWVPPKDLHRRILKSEEIDNALQVQMPDDICVSLCINPLQKGMFWSVLARTMGKYCNVISYLVRQEVYMIKISEIKQTVLNLNIDLESHFTGGGRYWRNTYIHIHKYSRKLNQLRRAVKTLIVGWNIFSVIFVDL